MCIVVRYLSWPFRLVISVLAGALLVTGAGVGIAPQVWAGLNAHGETALELPEFVALAQRSYVYDRNGNTIAVLQLENSQPIDIGDISEEVLAALLAVEDAEFFSHEGVNLRALVRALLSNFQTASVRQGASTITQQVVKNDMLAGLERDGRYKLLQARYAVLLERILTKQQILERYLNTVFFGNNAYGLAAAAETYFGKSASELTMIEGAFLAGLVQAPSSYDPIRRPERSRVRFVQVLDRLKAVGLIDEDEEKDLAENWPLPERVRVVVGRSLPRTYFTETVKDYLLNRTTLLGDTYSERYNRLFRGGISVTTTLDSAMQTAAEQARVDQLPFNLSGIEAAMVSVDTGTGAVRAMVGGSGFRAGSNEVNLALRRRQTGSSIKIFILAAAIEAGAQASDLIDGTRPCTLPNPDNPREPFEITQGVSRATSSLAEMSWLSINCAYARLSQIVGLYRVVDATYRMAASPYLTGDPQVDGSPSRPYQIQPFASYATGANEMSPLDVASGMQTIANGGLHHEPYFVERIEDSQGRLIYRHRVEGSQELSPQAASETVDILKGVLTSGTARRHQLAGGRPSSGKTGTQDNNTNAWFVGSTPQLTTAIWVGDPRAYTPMVNIPEFLAAGVGRVQGGTFPAAIWKAFMDAAHIDADITDWDPPPPPGRAPARLYLPGNECLAGVVSGTVPDVSPGTTTTTIPTSPSPSPSPTLVPRVQVLDSGTTIAPSVLDPRAPLPSIAPRGIVVFDCLTGLRGVTVETTTDGGR